MSDDALARRYARLQLLLGLVGLALTVAFLLAMLVTGAAPALAAWAARMTGSPTLTIAIVVIVLGLAHALLTFPLAWLRGFYLPRRFGLLHQPLGAWLRDRAKAAAIGGALALGGIETIYALLRVTDWWWLVAALAFLAAYVVMATVFPVWVLPLFYRLTPLEDAALRQRLLDLARRVGVPAVDVFVVDQSRKSRTANAALAGLGRTRRIILFDTLVKEFESDEIESVLAHELAHHVHRDVHRGLVAQAVITLVTFRLTDVALDAGVRLFDLHDPAAPASVPWLALVLMLLGLAAAPVANGFSRWLERRADDFALRVTGNTAAFVRAMERLARLNLAERRPSRIKEFMLYSHPAIDRRIARARGAG